MKNLLLCGAAFGAIIVASPAQAADDSAVQLGIGGYFKGYVNWVDQDEAAGQSVHDLDILRRTEIHFDGKTKLDNGLTVGAHIEGVADAGSGFAVDETYAYFMGDWGKVNLGALQGSSYLLQVVAPAADSNIDGRVQLIQPVNYTVAGVALGTSTETDYDHDVSAKFDKLTYLTPVWSGFQAGVSYTPDGTSSSRGLTGNATDDDAGEQSDIWDLGARYENKTDSFSYRVGAGYSKGQGETAATEDREAWNVGLDFDIGAFGVGASYMVDDLGDADDDVQYMVLGADYTMGSYVFGASYYSKDDEVNTVDLDRISAGVTYKVVPGLQFRGSAHFYDIEEGAGDDTDATAILIGTDIKF